MKKVPFTQKDYMVLIDGTSFIYRAYFAIPGHLATSKGFPTKAIFGVTQMLLKILKQWDPPYIIWFMDEEVPTFRHHVFEAYKATRPKMPDDLKVQIPYVRKIISSLGIPIVSCPGYEADDLMASFLKTFPLPAILITADKDLYSLITSQIVFYDPIRDYFLDENEFIKKYGFSPSLFPEFKALIGDPSDNLPGIPGIGEKTAKELILKFRSLKNLYENLSSVPLKLREKLLKYKEQTLNNLSLIKLNIQAPLPSKDLSFYQKKSPNLLYLKELFKELEFRKFLSELPFPKLELTPEVKKLENLEPLKALHRVALLPFEFKKTLFNSHTFQGLLLSLSKDLVLQVEFSSTFKKALEELETLFWVYDYKSLAKKLNLSFKKVLDTKLASYLLNPSLKNYSLEFLFQEYLDFKVDTFKRKNLEELAKKTSALFLLGEILEKKVEEENLKEWLIVVETPLSLVLAEMEKKGIKIDLDYVRSLNQEYQQKLKNLEEKIFQEVGFRFNPRSSQEVAHLLFEKLKLPKIKPTPKGLSPSTDAEVLEELAPLHPVAELLLQYRALYKLKSTYLEAFLKHLHPLSHRIHTEFNQTGTATGRLSSQNPNLQNIPIKGEEGLAIRRAFIAEEGFLLCSVDYSQIELRILAHFSEDENLLKAFEKEEDIHTYTASEVFGVPSEKVTPEMRRMSKIINFGIAYGMSAYGLSKQLKIDVKSAEVFISKYFERYPKIKHYIEKTINFAKEKGYVKTLVGRKRYVPEIFSSEKSVRELGQRIAINTPIQGSAADLIKTAMVALFKELKKLNLQTTILLQVHDELVLEVPEDEVEIIKEILLKLMPNPFEYLELPYRLKVPLKVHLNFGKNWAECK